MRRAVALLLGALAGSGCSAGPAVRTTSEANLAAAEAFIDAFYSFDSDRLKEALSSAQESIPEIVYYQGWAEGGNYAIVNRMPCEVKSAREARCSITVKDDLLGALGLAFQATDTFHLSFSDGKIVRVQTSSNDPELFDEALEWVRHEYPQLLSGACLGFFDGGPTPRECAQAVVRGFAEFTRRRRSSPPSG